MLGAGSAFTPRLVTDIAHIEGLGRSEVRQMTGELLKAERRSIPAWAQKRSACSRMAVTKAATRAGKK